MRRFTYTASVFFLAVCAVLLWGGTGEAEAKTKSKKGLAYFNEPAIGFAVEKYDKNKDGKFSEKELAKITKIYIDAEQREIDLKELKYLKNLKSFVIFDVEGYPIRRTKHASALYKLKKIKKIHIDDCDLSKGFKTAQWKNLKILSFSHCKVKNLSLKKNKKLEELSIDESRIPSLDVTKNTELKSFTLSSTKLKKLNLSKNRELRTFTLSSAKLKKLDLSKNKKLTSLSLEGMVYVKIHDIKLYQKGSRLQDLSFRYVQGLAEIDLTDWNLTNLKKIHYTSAFDEDNHQLCNLKKVVMGNAPELQEAWFYAETLEYLEIKGAFNLEACGCGLSSSLKKVRLSMIPAYLGIDDTCEVEIIK